MPQRERHWEEIIPELSSLKVGQRMRTKYGGYWYHAEILEIDTKREIPIKVTRSRIDFNLTIWRA